METLNKQQHNEEIAKTRVGGFGGSDAEMLAKIGRNGLATLSATDRRRIAVAKGLMPYSPIASSEAMQKGHLFEDFVADLNCDLLDREVLLSQPLARNFKTFAHADFVRDGITVIECKCTGATPEETAEHYKYQLQWYYLLGAPSVVLYHHPQAGELDTLNLTVLPVDRDMDIIAELGQGIAILDEAWDSDELTTVMTSMSEWTSADLMPHEEQEIANINRMIARIKAMEAEVDEFKKRFRDLMADNHLTKVTCGDVTITYVQPSTRKTFDKNALKKAHPEINLHDYEKETFVSDSVRITIG